MVAVPAAEQVAAVVEIVGMDGVAFIVMFTPLSVPVVEGAELITRILYPVPAGVLQGIVAVIVPLFAVLVRVPIDVGAAKLPAELDN